MEIKNKSYNPNFKALHIANCGNLKLYKLTDSNDKKFLKMLPENIRMKDLMPNLTKDEYSRWDEMLEYAVYNALDKNNITYIETLNNKPCGIITFFPDRITELDCICTWPIEIGKKVQLAGKTLFYQMFKDFEKIKGGKKIKLEAITNGPYDTVHKYENLGFIQTATRKTKVEMETTTPKIKETLKKLERTLQYEPAEKEKVNLILELDI